MAGKTQYTIEEMRQKFLKEGYVLLSQEYINSHTKLSLKCPKGHKNSKTWCEFRDGHRCSICVGNVRYTIGEIRQIFEKEGFELLSNEYHGAHVKLDYICPRGHHNSIIWTSFQQGYRCPDCKIDSYRLRLSQVKEGFEKEGYGLLSTQYINVYSKLDFICPKGHEDSIDWNHFQQGQRCPQCREWKGEKKLGEILRQIFPFGVKRQDNLDFLGRLHVDFSVREKRLAFEYDGQHHFHPVQYGGISEERASQNFEKQQINDSLKNELCSKQNYYLIRFTYKEKLSVRSVRKKIKQILKEKI